MFDKYKGKEGKKRLIKDGIIDLFLAILKRLFGRPLTQQDPSDWGVRKSKKDRKKK